MSLILNYNFKVMDRIGKYIEEALVESKMRPALFARAIHVSPRNIYNIFARESIDTSQLFAISKVLSVDLFKLYSKKLIEEEPLKFAAEPGAEYGRRNKRRVMIEVELDEAEFEELIKKTTR